MAKKISQKEILKKTWSQYTSMSKQDVFQYAQRASILAKSRRTRLINKLIEKNMPLPSSLQRWTTKKSIPDKFDQNFDKLSEITGQSNYDRGYGNIDFSVNDKMSKDELLHKLNVAKKFIQAETSTIGGWEKYYNKIINRISDKLNRKISPTEYPKYWELYNSIKEKMRISSQFAGKFDYGKSEQAQQDIAKYMVENNFTIDNVGDLIQILESDWREEYEKEQELEDDDGQWI